MHRDIKPANFVMGIGKASPMVNVIDFGLAKKFRDSKTSLHIPYKQDDYHGVGTSLFAAINTHLGVGTFSLSLMCRGYGMLTLIRLFRIIKKRRPRIPGIYAHLLPTRNTPMAQNPGDARSAHPIRRHTLRSIPHPKTLQPRNGHMGPHPGRQNR